METQNSLLTEPTLPEASSASDSIQTRDLAEGSNCESGSFIQGKLTIGSVDDPLEQEAESTADKVTRMTENHFIQRKCVHCEEDEIKRSPSPSFVQMKGGGISGEVGNEIASQINASQGQGSGLSSPVRSFMETRFKADFSQVKIHTGERSVQLSRELNAKAFTVGNDIYFNEGQYKPQSEEGKHLIAHELTHTLQQNGTTKNKTIQRMLACPSSYPAMPSTDWRPYPNSTTWFHCGFRTILENRAPTPADPMNECVYDHSGVLVDSSHPYAGCRGTPDQYDGHGGMSTPYDTLMHTFCDSGGIVAEGLPAFITSRRYEINSLIDRSTLIPTILKPGLITTVNYIFGIIEGFLGALYLPIKTLIGLICALVQLLISAIAAGMRAIASLLSRIGAAVAGGVRAFQRFIMSTI